MLTRAALLLLLPSLALAQATGQVAITESNDADAYVNLDECTGAKTDNLTLTWQVASGGVPPTSVPGGTTVSLTISKDTACPPASSAVVWTPTTTLNAQGSASGSYPASGTALRVVDVLTQLNLNSCASQRTTLYACAAMTIAATTYTATGNVMLDTQQPPAPVLGSVAPGDSALTVSFSAGATTSATPATSDHYQAQATGPGGQTFLSSTTTTSPAKIKGLTNGVTYDVVVFAYNAAGNQSAASSSGSGTPVPVIDFWEAYKSDGGREQGGCGAGSAGGLAPVLAFLALALRRRLS